MQIIINVDEKYSHLVIGLLSNLKKNVIKNITLKKESPNSDLSAVETYRKLRAKSNNQKTLTMDIATNTQGLIDDAIF
jgi:hypothetical protein